MKHKVIIFVVLIVIFFLAADGRSRAQAFSCPTYSPQTSALIVKEIYKRVLERNVDDGGLVLFSGKISGGGWCVQQIVRAVGVSPEYADRFIKNQTPRQAVVLMYRHFLLREPESEQVINHHVNELNGKGWQAKVLDFVNSPEASKTWGDLGANTSPMSVNFQSSGAESQLVAAGCKFFLGRKGQYLCNNQSGFNLCETKRKDPNNSITSCQLAGVIPEIDKALTSQGCTRNAAGEYTCLSQKAFDSCEAYRKANKVKVCRRTAIKIGGNK